MARGGVFKGAAYVDNCHACNSLAVGSAGMLCLQEGGFFQFRGGRDIGSLFTDYPLLVYLFGKVGHDALGCLGSNKSRDRPPHRRGHVPAAISNSSIAGQRLQSLAS